MRKNKIKIFCLLFSLFFMLSLATLPREILAKEIKVTLDPAIKTYDLQAGEKISDTINLRNQGKDDLQITLKIIKASLGQNGETQLGEETQEDWINYQLNQSFNLTAGATKEVKFELRVPKEVTDKTKSFALAAEVSSPAEDLELQESGARSQIKAQLACLFLINIFNGRPMGSLEIASLDFGGFTDNDAIKLVSQIRNTGEIYAAPQVIAELKSSSGKTIERASLIPGVILPAADREFTFNLPTKNHLGRLTATISVPNFQGGFQTQSVSFWVVPLWFKITFPILVLIIILSFSLILKFKILNPKFFRLWRDPAKRRW